MSRDTSGPTGQSPRAHREQGHLRLLLLASTLVLVWSYLSVLYGVVDVVGSVRWFTLAVGIALLLGVVSARYLRTRITAVVALLALVVGLGIYLRMLPGTSLSIATLPAVLDNAAALLTGTSVLQLTRADYWVMAVAPPPVFLTVHATLRGRSETSAFVGAIVLGLLILTGDAGATTTLAGTVSILAILGIQGIERAGGGLEHLADLGLLLAVIVVLTRAVRMPTAGTESDTSGASGGSGTEGTALPEEPSTLEGTLLGADAQVPVQGAMSLSPKVRFTVVADRGTYWHVDTYDRYTGSEWIRTGSSTSYDGELGTPPGETTEYVQQFTVESTVEIMPAAWKPIRVVNSAAESAVTVTSTGHLRPERPLSEGDTYTVVSSVLEWTDDDLVNAETTYPSSIRNRYLQLPESTPWRVARKAKEVTADSSVPIEKAATVEQYLKQSKEYSLQVDRPSGDVADAFLFGMEAGYCVYFATAMVVMLRALDVPARFVIGYTPGQQVADRRWVLRGLDAHTWVEVYVPGTGWVAFDPTPSDERRAAEQARLTSARDADEPGVDTDESDPAEAPEQNGSVSPATNENQTETATPSGVVSGDSVDETVSSDEDDDLVESPVAQSEQRSTTANAIEQMDRLSLLAGVAALVLGAYRFGIITRVAQELRLQRQLRTDSPDADTIRAYERLEQFLEREERKRLERETVRQYLGRLASVGVDARVLRVTSIYERAQYGDGVSRDEAEEAIDIVDDLLTE